MFDNYLFYASSVGNLFVEPRTKSETLSETTKSWLNEIFIYKYFGRRKEINSKYLSKGTTVEEIGISLYQNNSDHLFLVKNEDQFSNDYITGTPDLITQDMVIDIKCSWDLWSFFKSDGTNKMYYYQLQSYMYLIQKQKAALAYCLVDTPDFILESELHRLKYQYSEDDLTDAEAKTIDNLTFGDIDERQRIKVFEFEYDPTFEERLTAKVTAAREYLNNLLIEQENKLK